MPFRLPFCKTMEEFVPEVSVVDVYDIASDIGKEFEKIIDTHGAESVADLIPKVISALEHLEELATRNERENTTVEELKSRIVQLESEKIEKAEDRQRFEKELEQIEEHWRQESHDLMALVSKLQEENRKLYSLAEKKNSSSPVSGIQSANLEMDMDVAVMQRLRELIDQQRDKIRAQDKELSMKATEVDSLTAQVERFTMVGKELRRKHRTSQQQVRNLIDERADFLAQLQDQQRELVILRQRLGIAQKENEDLAKYQSEAPDLSNKVVYDVDDPNRPRFTTAELKEILQERNELKARVSDLEDELEMYRPKPSKESPSEEEDPPVQGPLPFEPDDAPWKKSESGIRKFMILKGTNTLKNSMENFECRGTCGVRVFVNYSARAILSHFLAAVPNVVCHHSPRWHWLAAQILTCLSNSFGGDFAASAGALLTIIIDSNGNLELFPYIFRKS